MNTERLKELTRTAAVHLEDEMLAVHIEDTVRMIVAFLAYIYTAGVVAREYVLFTIDKLTPVMSSVSKAFTYQSTPQLNINND